MNTLDKILHALSESTIALEVSTPHDEARMRFMVKSNTVGSFEEYAKILGEYYNYHFTTCVSRGGQLSQAEAAGRAKEILARDYRKRNGDINTAYHDAHAGTNGGLRVQLDIIADALKLESTERYMRHVFDQCIPPNEWDPKVQVVEQLIAHFPASVRSSIDASHPERYAHDYEPLIRALLAELQRTTTMFRRS
jgi:hypothetical protein